MPASLQIRLQSPRLSELVERARALVENPAQLHEAMAQVLVNGAPGVTGIREHIKHAAETRHKTADRLGAKRTGFLQRAVNNIEAKGEKSGARVVINNGAPIFARTFGPVEVRPVRTKWLAIPVHKISYGKSPLNFAGRLKTVIKSPELGLMFLVPAKQKTAPNIPTAESPKKPEKRAQRQKAKKARKAWEQDPERPLLFVLKKKTKLPQDRGLLPSDKGFMELAKQGLKQGLDLEEKRILQALG